MMIVFACQGAFRWMDRAAAAVLALAALSLTAAPQDAFAQAVAPSPLLSAGHPVDWFFAFKTNTATAPASFDENRPCAFGGKPKDYPRGFSLSYGLASSKDPTFAAAPGDIGAGEQDPVGATFGEIYNGHLNFVIWNDQFYSDPNVHGCGDACLKPWAHSKGMIAWDDSGAGFVMQVSTPSWPAAGSKAAPRQNDGNTLGCVSDNDVLVSQHFFALKLDKAGVENVLRALANASIVTDPANPQIVRNGGPKEIRELVDPLAHRSSSTEVKVFSLSDNIRVISKPSAVTAPPWQLVSAQLGATPLLVANWWEPSPTKHPIPDTTATTPMSCLDVVRFGKPGAVTIARQGNWKGQPIGLLGGSSADKNHAKVAVSTDPSRPYTIFGDMNQEGALSAPCTLSQNPRGGLFYVVQDPALTASVTTLISPPPEPH